MGQEIPGQRPSRRGLAALPRRRKTRKQRARRVLVNLAAVFVILVMAFPIYWMVLTAFKPGPEILTLTPKFLPSQITLDNFRAAIERPFFCSSRMRS